MNYTNQGTDALNTNYAKALQPAQQNFGQAQQGVGALGNVLGLNGPAGTQSALTALQTTPGYQFQLGQGQNAINAAAAAGGTNNSGNQALALQKFGQNLAGTTYDNYVAQLQPYLGYASRSASDIGNLYSGLGSGINQNLTSLGHAGLEASVGAGNAEAQGILGQQNFDINAIKQAIQLATSAATGMPNFGGGQSGFMGGNATGGMTIPAFG